MAKKTSRKKNAPKKKPVAKPRKAAKKKSVPKKKVAKKKGTRKIGASPAVWRVICSIEGTIERRLTKANAMAKSAAHQASSGHATTYVRGQ